MPDPTFDAIKAISNLIQQSESIHEDIRTDFAIADAMQNADNKIFAISKAVACDDKMPLEIKKAWLSHLQFVIAGAETFAAENGIATEEEES